MNKNDKMLKEVIDLINRMKSTRPLVECLTNRVTINDCANMLLAMGASLLWQKLSVRWKKS